MAPLADSISAITQSRPPATDPVTYLTIVESHLSKEILPHLNELLQDAELTQLVGWDLITQLVGYGAAAEECLNTIARLGNPREVILKITETLQYLDLEEFEDDERNAEDGEEEEDEQGAADEQIAKDELAETSEKLKGTKLMGKNELEEAQQVEMDPYVEKFCLLLKLLAIVHPRIKTKYPSRFLASSLNAILSSYRPSQEATLSIVLFVHTLSDKKRPQLPGRKSSIAIQPSLSTPDGKSSAEPAAPDPEAEAEDPQEAQIQKSHLQIFLTHLLRKYIDGNGLEWSARVQELYLPSKLVPGRKTLGEKYKEDPILQQRDTTVGQLVALIRDLGLTDPGAIMNAIHDTRTDRSSEFDALDTDWVIPVDLPEDIPLSKTGCLYLLSCFVFSSVYLGNSAPTPDLRIFPDHVKLVRRFVGAAGADQIGTESPATIDALIFLGIWLEHNNKFVSGPLADEDFLLHMQFLTLISANSPSATSRYNAHLLTSSILHAHPDDRMRLSFITDTLEHCPYVQLKALAIGWLKDEIISAKQRNVENAFSKTVALASAQPYLFPDLSPLPTATTEEILAVLDGTWDYHMTVLNFLFFLKQGTFVQVIPTGMWSVVEMIYLGPLKEIQQRLVKGFEQGGELADESGAKEFKETLVFLGGIIDQVFEQ